MPVTTAFFTVLDIFGEDTFFGLRCTLGTNGISELTEL